jgi:hypothetical protein
VGFPKRKKSIVVIFLVLSLIFLEVKGRAERTKPQIEIGFLAGLRTLNNADLKSVYGNGFIFFPSITLIWRGIIFGGGYETGFKKNGLIGIYQEPAQLTVNEPEIYAGYQLTLNKFAPYLKLGWGFYSYKQVVNSPYVSNYPVNGKKSGLIFAAGFKFYPIKRMFISAEIKYGALKVKPYDQVVDIGGMRLNGGLGICF